MSNNGKINPNLTLVISRQIRYTILTKLSETINSYSKKTYIKEGKDVSLCTESYQTIHWTVRH